MPNTDTSACIVSVNFDVMTGSVKLEELILTYISKV